MSDYDFLSMGDPYAPQAKCELCGSPVRVVGETTLSYEPVQASEVREFWLNPNPDCRGWSEGKPDDWLLANTGAIRAVEHAAYLSLAAELEKVKRERDELREIMHKFERHSSIHLVPREERDHALAQVKRLRGALESVISESSWPLAKTKAQTTLKQER